MANLPNLHVAPGSLPPNILLPGDPGRVKIIGTYLSNVRILSSYREFVLMTGCYKGIKIGVVSTGIGCPSTAMAVEEAIRGGARRLIRVGTCGGAWRGDIACGSVVIPTACVRDEGTTKEYIPIGFPAIASLDVVNALVAGARKVRANFFVGINRTHDAYYAPQSAIISWGTYLQDERFKNQKTPILTSEMESAALFVIASLYNVQAGCVLAVNADPEPLRDRCGGKYMPVVSKKSQKISSKVVDLAIRTSLEALVRLS